MKREQTILTPISETDRKLRIECEHVLLRGLIDRAKQDDLSHEQFCKCLQVYCELKKHDVAAEKNIITVETARDKNTAAQGAIAGKTSASDHDYTAPYGRNNDGTPYTRDEFRRGLAQSVADIYGLSGPATNTTESVEPPPQPPDRQTSSRRTMLSTEEDQNEPDRVTARPRAPPPAYPWAISELWMANET